MVTIKNIKPVQKSKYLMNKIVLAKNKKELTSWRRKSRKRFKQIFYGSPRKNTKGYYALAQTK